MKSPNIKSRDLCTPQVLIVVIFSHKQKTLLPYRF